MSMQRKSSYHHGNLKQALLEASRDILEHEGLEALSLRAVARHVGVSQTASYSHFADKRALLVAVALDGFQRFGARLSSESRRAGSNMERLLALARGYVGFALDNPALFRLMFGAHSSELLEDPTLQQAAQATYQQLSDAIAKRLGPGAVEPKRLQSATLAAWSLVHGLSQLLLDGRVALADASEEERMALVESVARMLDFSKSLETKGGSEPDQAGT